MKALLRGLPGIGKTTAVIALAAKLKSAGIPATGFYTEEMRADGRRVGFKIVSIKTGEEATIAHVGIKSPFKVGKYGVDVGAFEKVAMPSISISSPDEVVIVDEIGKMELFSEKFKRKLRELLSLPNPIVATIPIQRIGFIQTLINEYDPTIIDITEKNRDELPEELGSFLNPG